MMILIPTKNVRGAVALQAGSLKGIIVAGSISPTLVVGREGRAWRSAPGRAWVTPLKGVKRWRGKNRRKCNVSAT